MTTKIQRCYHCNIEYPYHPSGIIDEFNNSRYCPDCYKVVLEALKDVPKKVVKVYLPVIEGTANPPVTIEEFKESRKTMMLPVNRVTWPSNNINIQCAPEIRGIEYELHVNRVTGEELLYSKYEMNVETKEITGVW